MSKTFAATLAAYAVESGTFSLSEKASAYLPALSGSALDKVDVLDLGTYTAGGLPLQVPDDVTNQDGMIAYFRPGNRSSPREHTGVIPIPASACSAIWRRKAWASRSMR